MYGSRIKLFLRCACGVILLFLVSTQAHSSTVERVLAKDIVNPWNQLSVELHVTVDQGVNFYAIDETYPDGWSVMDDGGFNADDPGHLKMVVLQNAEDTVYTYKLRAPLGSGVYTFYGEFEFEGDGEVTEIEGDGDILVGQCYVDDDCDDDNPCTDDICRNGTCSRTPVRDLDEDGDGYEAGECGGDDCNDDDEDVNPGVEESDGAGNCRDRKDNDCDGFIDSDPECQPKSGSPRVQSDGDGGGGCGSAVFGVTTDANFAHLGVAGCLYLAPLGFIWWKRRRMRSK